MVGLDALRQRTAGLLDQVFGIDVRGAAALRIGLALILLIDLADRARDTVSMYTDAGVLPRSVVPGVDGRLSFHMMSGQAWWQALLMGVAALLAVALLLGFRTRTVMVLSWILNFSIQTRNPLVLYGGDIVLRVTMFWALFLPLGEVWSLDARARGGPPRYSRAAHAGTFGYLAQVALIYITTAALKSGVDWQNGTAVYYALSIDTFTEPIGGLLLPYYRLTGILTFLVYWFETIGPWLLLVPSWRLRSAVVFGFIAMHLSFEVFMEIGLFPWTSALTWVPLLPSELFDRLRLPRLSGATERLSGLSTGVAIAAVIYITVWNLGTVYPKPFGITGVARAPARMLRLDQYWDMFAPQPFRDDGWFVVVGERNDGKLTDVMHGGGVVWAKPANVPHTYKNERWRKYMRNLWDKRYSSLRKPYLRWACRDWNRNASERAQLKTISLYYMREDSPPPGQRTSARKILLEKATCSQPKAASPEVAG